MSASNWSPSCGETRIFPGRRDLPFRHTAGRIASHFLHGLKEKRILATRCPRCRRALMRPRPFCERCFMPLEEWVEIGQQGTLEAFMVCYAPSVPRMVAAPPFKKPAIDCIRIPP